MSRGMKIALIVIIVIVALAILGYLLAKYTTIGMSYRVDRLHDQIESRYVELNDIYEADEAKELLEAELNDNRLIQSAAFEEDMLVIEYTDGTMEDYYVGQED